MDIAYNVQPPRPSEISHEVAIDAMSTLGHTAVTTLVNEPSPISDWSSDSKQRVLELAALRDTSVGRVQAQFSDLFTEPGKPQNHAALTAPFLEESYTQHDGTLPVLITAPHNGWRTVLGELELPRANYSKPADGATRFIAQDVHHFLRGQDLPAPTVLVDAVHRAHRTPQTRAFFEYKTYEALCNLRRKHDGPVLHLDIHGFGLHQEAKAYDLILGTAHRKTVGDSIADHELAAFTTERGYRTYLPGPQPSAHEIYTARNPATLIQRVGHLSLDRTASIQIEIGPDFRTKETQARGEQLARDLGTFCLEWAQSPLESGLGVKS